MTETVCHVLHMFASMANACNDCQMCPIANSSAIFDICYKISNLFEGKIWDFDILTVVTYENI